VKPTSYEAPHYAVFHQPPATSSLLVSNILLSTLFSNSLNLYSPHSVRDNVSHPYKTSGKIIVFINFSLSYSRQEAGRKKTFLTKL
jgi:hypothetical protein